MNLIFSCSLYTFNGLVHHCIIGTIILEVIILPCMFWLHFLREHRLIFLHFSFTGSKFMLVTMLFPKGTELGRVDWSSGPQSRVSLRSSHHGSKCHLSRVSRWQKRMTSHMDASHQLVQWLCSIVIAWMVLTSDQAKPVIQKFGLHAAAGQSWP